MGLFAPRQQCGIYLGMYLLELPSFQSTRRRASICWAHLAFTRTQVLPHGVEDASLSFLHRLFPGLLSVSFRFWLLILRPTSNGVANPICRRELEAARWRELKVRSRAYRTREAIQTHLLVCSSVGDRVVLRCGAEGWKAVRGGASVIKRGLAKV